MNGSVEDRTGFSVFGYGSLTNTRTLPPYLAFRRATLVGWRRAWRATSIAHAGGVCALSVVEAEGETIDGLVVTFDREVRPVVDAREVRYDPLPAVADGQSVIVFRARPEIDRYGDRDHPIHLSYLDVIVQGFIEHYGSEGVRRFAASTDGWHVPVVDDRAAPNYPRHQRLTQEERTVVDRLLVEVGATVIER